jgi:hypothetical protein
MPNSILFTLPVWLLGGVTPNIYSMVYMLCLVSLVLPLCELNNCLLLLVCQDLPVSHVPPGEHMVPVIYNNILLEYVRKIVIFILSGMSDYQLLASPDISFAVSYHWRHFQ